jgi:GT2 family glycosyltransferase
MPSPASVDVSILLVSYNTCDLTRAALDSVLSETCGTTFEVIAVDNASNDGSAAMLASHPLKPRVIALDTNIGFARANNLAAKDARGKYLLLLNPDTVILDRAIDRLVAFAHQTPEALIWGGRTLFADRTLNPSSCWGRITAWNLVCRAAGLTAVFPNSAIFNSEALGGWQRDSVRRVDVVTGCFFLIERELWDRLGGFDPLFFMYGEEADLCLRARAFKADPMVTPEATIIHFGGASERVRADKMVRLLSAKASLIDLHWQPAMAPLGRALLAAWPLTRAIATSIQRALNSSTSAQESAMVWRDVWARRAEWRHGYATRPRPRQAGTAAAAAAS